MSRKDIKFDISGNNLINSFYQTNENFKELYDNLTLDDNEIKYFISNNGDNTNDGLTKDTPFKTIQHLRTIEIPENATIYLKAGDTFISNAFIQSNLTYKAYGSGRLPVLTTGIPKNDSTDWENTSGNLWKTSLIHYEEETTENLLSGDNAEENNATTFQNNDVTGWEVYTEGSGQLSRAYAYEDNRKCMLVTSSNNGSSTGELQLLTRVTKNEGFEIEGIKVYEFSFDAKAESEFTIPQIGLFKNSSPYTSVLESTIGLPTITTTWKTHKIYITTLEELEDPRLVIYLGNVIPINENFYMDSISFKKVGTDYLTASDAGFAYVNESKILGNRFLNIANVDAYGKCYVDPIEQSFYMYNVGNPASMHNSIRVALDKHIVQLENVENISIEGIDIQVGGGHGIYMSEVENIIIESNKIQFCGGSNLESLSVGYGNLIEGWQGALNVTIRDNFLNGGYDAGITFQGLGNDGAYIVDDILIENNTIKNCHYLFEFWGHEVDGNTIISNLKFHNNICLGAGYSWSSGYRNEGVLDSYGCSVVIGNVSATLKNISFKYNVFQSARDYIYRWHETVNINDIDNIDIAENNIMQDNKGIGKLALWNYSTEYDNTLVDWNAYKLASGKDENTSII